jgi:hypothetical protein
MSASRPAVVERGLLAGLTLVSSFACSAHRARTSAAAALRADGPNSAPGVETVTGSLASRYRGRFAGDEDDHDLSETVDLALTDPDGLWKASVLARGLLDLDGRDRAEDLDFFSLADTYDHAFVPQLFHAYVDLEKTPLELVRIGRQPLYETPVTVVLDGVRLDGAPSGAARVHAGAYAGIGEHPYESSSSGDFVGGAFGSATPWEDAELRLDWMHLEDARLGEGHEDDLLGVALVQDLPGARSASRIEGRFTSLEGDGRDVRVSGSHADGLRRWSLQGSIYRLLRTQEELAAPLDPFSDTLFELFPFTQAALSATKDWESVSITGGADVRRVDDASDEGEFNRDFERFFATVALPDVLGVSASLTGESWDATDADFESWGATLAHELAEPVEVALGTYYSLFKYDLFTGEERDHVRTYYLDLVWRPRPTQRWALRYELERNDSDDFHQLRLEHTWTF